MSTHAHPLLTDHDDDFIHFFKILSPGIFQEARDLFEAGYSLDQIAKRVGRSKGHVRRTLIAGGISMRPSVKTPEGKQATSERRLAGTAPYGFTYLRGRLVVNPLEIEHVLTIVDLWKKGRSLMSIVREFNESGIRPRTGKQWNVSTIFNIIKRHSKNPELLGSAAQFISSNKEVHHGTR